MIASVTLTFLAAAATPGQDSAPVPAAQPVKEKKICRSEEVTGSIMPKRVCRTKAEWDSYLAQIGAKVRDEQRTLPTASGR